MGDTAEMIEHYKSLTGYDETTLVVRGRSVDEVVEALGGVPADSLDEDELYGEEPVWAVYALVAIEGGVVATEGTGYADPPNAVLTTLSEGGRAAAVVRDNIQAHGRFGYARDGELLFDDDEWRFLAGRDSVPDEVRALFDLGWLDLADDDSEPPEEDTTVVGLAMAEVATGLRLTSADMARLAGDDATAVAVRQLQYLDD
jgi:hypothetical protein